MVQGWRRQRRAQAVARPQLQRRHATAGAQDCALQAAQRQVPLATVWKDNDDDGGGQPTGRQERRQNGEGPEGRKVAHELALQHQ